MADTVQASYEMLEQVAAKFTQQSEAIADMLQNVRNHMESLEGEWIGLGHDSFFQEMDGEVLPACTRLQQALAQAGSNTSQISTLMRNTEQQAASAFQVYVQ